MNHSLLEIIEILTNKLGDFENLVKNNSGLDNLTTHQLAYLEAIYKLDNPSTTELAEELKITKPSITNGIDKLEEKGYVIRVKSDNDKRFAHLHLTEKGKLVQKMHDDVHKQIVTIFNNSLSKEELSILLTLLNKVVKNIK